LAVLAWLYIFIKHGMDMVLFKIFYLIGFSFLIGLGIYGAFRWKEQKFFWLTIAVLAMTVVFQLFCLHQLKIENAHMSKQLQKQEKIVGRQ
jgi:hypothetical protein